MKLMKKLVPIFALAAAVTLAGCDVPSSTQNQPAPSPPAATQTAPARETGFHYGVHVGPHYNMSTGSIDMLSIGPGIDF